MRAIEASRKPLAAITVEASLKQVAEQMEEKAVGALVVLDGDEAVGIVTDRDLVVRAVARGLPAGARVDGVMSRDLVTLDADTDLRDAYALFRRHAMRRLPLVREGRVVALLALDDLLVDVISDLADCVRPVVGEVLFGHREPPVPALDRVS